MKEARDFKLCFWKFLEEKIMIGSYSPSVIGLMMQELRKTNPAETQ